MAFWSRIFPCIRRTTRVQAFEPARTRYGLKKLAIIAVVAVVIIIVLSVSIAVPLSVTSALSSASSGTRGGPTSNTTINATSGPTNVSTGITSGPTGGASNAAIVCKGGWIERVNMSTWYCFSHSAQRTWNQAVEACRLIGGHLVDIRTEDEWLFVKVHLINGTAAHDQYFIGISDIASEGSWKYLDGTDATYVNWASGEPNGGRRENCGAMYSNFEYKGRYNDNSCTYKGRYVCKK